MWPAGHVRAGRAAPGTKRGQHGRRDRHRNPAALSGRRRVAAVSRWIREMGSAERYLVLDEAPVPALPRLDSEMLEDFCWDLETLDSSASMICLPST